MIFRIAVCCVLLLMGLTAMAVEPEAVPATGKPFPAKLEGINADWQIRFVDRQPRAMSAADLVHWGAFVEATRSPHVVLRNGGLIVADVRGFDATHLHGESKPLGQFDWPVELISAVIFHPSSDQAARDPLNDRLLSAAGKTDRVILDNGDELSGKLVALADGRLTLDGETGHVDVDLKKVAAVSWELPRARQAPPSGLRAWVGLRDGSRLLASSATTDGQSTSLKLAGGLDAKVPTDAIVALQPLGGRVVYLSDLNAAGYRHVPFLQIHWPYRDDRSVTGNHLRAGGRLYLKGLGMHSPSRLTYDLDQPYRQLQAELAIDDEAGSRGSVVFRVFVDDGNGHWQPRYASPTIRGGDAPLATAVDLSGAKRISLLVDYAERGDELDHADWLNARLVR